MLPAPWRIAGSPGLSLVLLPRSCPGPAPLHPAYLSPDSSSARSALASLHHRTPGLSSVLLAQCPLLSVQQALGEWISTPTALACSPGQGICFLMSLSLTSGAFRSYLYQLLDQALIRPLPQSGGDTHFPKVLRSSKSTKCRLPGSKAQEARRN